MSEREVGKAAYPQEGMYLCNCGRVFPGHGARTVHMVSCGVMATYREAADLRRRINLTLEYVDELLSGPLKPGEEMIAGAVRLVLTATSSNADSRAKESGA